MKGSSLCRFDGRIASCSMRKRGFCSVGRCSWTAGRSASVSGRSGGVVALGGTVEGRTHYLGLCSGDQAFLCLKL